MKSPDLKSLAEFVGVTAIVMSLLFLGYELKRANDIAEADAAATILGTMNDFALTMATDEEASQIWRRGATDYESLTPAEVRRFHWELTYVLNGHELAWKYYDRGIISKDDSDIYAEMLCSILRINPGVVDFWRQSESGHIPGFYSYIQKQCEISDSAQKIPGR